MNIQDYTPTQIEYILKWYPHCGQGNLAREMKLSNYEMQKIVQNLARNTGLKVLPRNKRLCAFCKLTKLNSKQGLGYYCTSCWNNHSYNLKANKMTPEVKMKELLQSAIIRGIKDSLVVTITLDELVDKWYEQKGLCYYSKIPMEFKPKRMKLQYRNPYIATLDQYNPKQGYTKENIVICTWIANAGKCEASAKEYIEFCKKVVANASS